MVSKEFTFHSDQRGMYKCTKKIEVLTGLFKLSKQHLWFCILPHTSFLDTRDDIQKATGVDWQYLLPLLCSSGLINVRVTSDVREINVCRVQWDELCAGISKYVRMQLTCCRLKGPPGEGKNTRAMQYFFCIGKPLFPSPYKQMEHDKKGQKRTTPTRTNTIHSELVKTIAVQIIYNHIYQCVMGKDVENSKRKKGGGGGGTQVNKNNKKQETTTHKKKNKIMQ